MDNFQTRRLMIEILLSGKIGKSLENLFTVIILKEVTIQLILIKTANR